MWTVRLDPYGRLSAGTVRLTCSRPACADQHFPQTGEGRKAAVGHVNSHLAHIRTGGGPRGEAWCSCRAADCAWHTPAPDTRPRNRPATGRCGGPVVLAVYADRAGRLWRIAEMCASCAAAVPGCRVLDTAPPPSRPTPVPSQGDHGTAEAASSAAPLFSDQQPAPSAAVPVPAARRTRRQGTIAQRIVPPDLQPEVLRDELIELGDAFRAYQQCAEPDLARLATLHERKARAFALWADLTGDRTLRQEAERAESAVLTTREMHFQRTGQSADGTGGGAPAVERLLTRGQAVRAREVLAHVQEHAPYPDAEMRLATLLFTLRAARTGAGNVTGQDLTGWLLGDTEDVLERLVTSGWLQLPGTIPEALASRPEEPAVVTVPLLLPGSPTELSIGKTNRARISGWAQKVVGDRKIRKKKLGAATRLLALYTAVHTRPDGRLGTAEDNGLPLDAVAAFCTLPPAEVGEHADLLIAADWLAEADVDGDKLRGQLAERSLPLGGLL
ncbi:hypothetical protein [Streptomyces sp. NBC_01465]|uniref:hypothetical protein n=1 Tax=Streptomyces sp. NBC_01465 TaxID=2903878 RepID=UPI002E334944|nr:hypothetical protein [Streptomyces sp. NBC_01465]